MRRASPSSGELKSADPSVRLIALRQLPDEPDSLPALLSATRDPSADIARVALRRLSEIGDSSAAAELRLQMLEADPGLIGDYAATLAALGDHDASCLAVEALQTGGPHRRIAAAMALEVLATGEQKAALVAALDDSLAAVRRCALTALARVGTQREAAPCARLLDDHNPQVRAEAVQAVAALAPQPSEILWRLRHDPAPQVRRALATRIGSLDGEVAEVLLGDRHRLVREAAIEAAWSEQAESLIQLLRGDPVIEVRMAAARRLAEMDVEAGSEALVSALADSSPMVRAAALYSLQEALGKRGAVARLTEVLGDAPGHLRRSIVYGLTRLDAREAEETVARLASDPDRNVRLAVVDYGRRLFGSGWAVLPQLHDDPDPAVHHAALIALEEERR